MKKKISIMGMSCEHCVKAVTNALKGLNIKNPQVSLENNIAIVNTDISNDDIIDAIEEEGYDVIDITEFCD